MQLSHSLRLMGTTIDIQINSKNAQKQIQEVIELLELYKNRFSANDFNSELMAINNNAGIKPIQVHPDLFELITIGKEHSLARPGNLNIAIGPLVQTWRIGFSDAKLPSPSEISEAMILSDPTHILLDSKNQSVFLNQIGMKIDLGALAKGYIADKIIIYLKNEMIDSAIINLGGNVLVHGDNPNRSEGYWVIGILRNGNQEYVRTVVPGTPPEVINTHNYQAMYYPDGSYAGINEIIFNFKPWLDWYLQTTGQRLVGGTTAAPGASAVDATSSASTSTEDAPVDQATDATSGASEH
ncbi:TPA: FAD:protein FMN transferase [Streptococcus agalactiae]